MEKSTFTPLYDAFRAKLIEMRKAAGEFWGQGVLGTQY